MFLVDTITTSHYVAELCICYQIVHPKNSYKYRKKNVIVYPQISINDFNIIWTFSYSIRHTFFSPKKETTWLKKNPTISFLSMPLYFLPTSEFRHSWSQLHPICKPVLSSIWWPREKMEMIYCHPSTLLTMFLQTEWDKKQIFQHQINGPCIR